MSDSLRPQGLPHTRLPCPSPSSGACSRFKFLFFSFHFSSLHFFLVGMGRLISTCNAGDHGSIPGSGRFAGEGIGYLLQYSWASLVARLIKNLPENAGEVCLISRLGRSLEKGIAIHSSILAWRIAWTI